MYRILTFIVLVPFHLAPGCRFVETVVHALFIPYPNRVAVIHKTQWNDQALYLFSPSVLLCLMHFIQFFLTFRDYVAHVDGKRARLKGDPCGVPAVILVEPQVLPSILVSKCLGSRNLSTHFAISGRFAKISATFYLSIGLKAEFMSFPYTVPPVPRLGLSVGTTGPMAPLPCRPAKLRGFLGFCIYRSN